VQLKSIAQCFKIQKSSSESIPQTCLLDRQNHRDYCVTLTSGETRRTQFIPAAIRQHLQVVFWSIWSSTTLIQHISRLVSISYLLLKYEQTEWYICIQWQVLRSLACLLSLPHATFDAFKNTFRAVSHFKCSSKSVTVFKYFCAAPIVSQPCTSTRRQWSSQQIRVDLTWRGTLLDTLTSIDG
jgi:hypothetical protein